MRCDGTELDQRNTRRQVSLSVIEPCPSSWNAVRSPGITLSGPVISVRRALLVGSLDNVEKMIRDRGTPEVVSFERGD